MVLYETWKAYSFPMVVSFSLAIKQLPTVRADIQIPILCILRPSNFTIRRGTHNLLTIPPSLSCHRLLHTLGQAGTLTHITHNRPTSRLTRTCMPLKYITSIRHPYLALNLPLPRVHVVPVHSHPISTSKRRQSGP
jgi:hypothetical protein